MTNKYPLELVEFKNMSVSDTTNAIQDFFVRQRGNATRKNIARLLETLDEINDLAEERVDTGWTGVIGADSKIRNAARISADINSWRERSAKYKEDIEIDDDAEFARRVIGPLLLGWYVDKPQQVRLDAVTPLITANMADVSEIDRKESWTRLIGDLEQTFTEVSKRIEGVGDAVAWATDPQHRGRTGVLIAGAVAIGAGITAAVLAIRKAI